MNRSHLKFIEADTSELKECVYRLRHDVFAVECGFEPIKHSGLEMDIYDHNSIHFVAMDGDDPVGTMRIIFSNEDGFPVDCVADTSGFTDRPIDELLIEVSRLAIAKKMRKKYSREIIIGLYDVAYYRAVELGITHMMMLVEPWLHNELCAIGLRAFKKIGNEVQYHGIREPYGASLAELNACLNGRMVG